MESNAESKILIIVIVGLFLVLIGTGLYMATSNKKTKNIEKEEQPQTEEPSESLDSAEIKTLIKNLTTTQKDSCGFYDYFENDTYNYQDLTNEEAFGIIINKIYNDKKESGITNPFTKGTIIYETEIETKLKELFPKDYNFSHKSFTELICPKFTYDTNNKSYTVLEDENCQTTCKAQNLYLIDQATKYKDSLDVDIRVVFVDTSKETIKYYTDYKKTNFLKEVADTDLYNQQTGFTKEEFEKASLYRLTFAIEEDNYVFKEARLIN